MPATRNETTNQLLLSLLLLYSILSSLKEIKKEMSWLIRKRINESMTQSAFSLSRNATTSDKKGIAFPFILLLFPVSKLNLLSITSTSFRYLIPLNREPSNPRIPILPPINDAVHTTYHTFNIEQQTTNNHIKLSSIYLIYSSSSFFPSITLYNFLNFSYFPNFFLLI